MAALDVGYTVRHGVESGRCAVVAFESWASRVPIREVTFDVRPVAPYVSGRLYERELPCLIAGLDALRRETVEIELTTVVVDGNVRLDPQGRPGLGMHLYRELAEQLPVVGVAKTAFRGLDAVEVLRGKSSKPLFVTAAGMDERVAARKVAGMHGPHRIPTMLRRADQLSRW